MSFFSSSITLKLLSAEEPRFPPPFHWSYLADKRSRLNKEIIEEGYRFIHGNVIIFLHRYLDLPPSGQEVANGPQPNLRAVLPVYESLVPFDSENKWIVTATVDILNANDQEHIQKGIEELLSVKEAFHGYFDFPLLDRRMLDTRLRS